MKTFLEDFVRGTARTAYPKDLTRTPGSISGKRGVTTLLLDVNSDDIHLVRIFTPKQFVGGGFGSKSLRWLCKLADRHGLVVCLVATAGFHRRLSTMELEYWYARHGFKFGDTVWMTRLPKKTKEKRR